MPAAPKSDSRSEIDADADHDPVSFEAFGSWIPIGELTAEIVEKIRRCRNRADPDDPVDRSGNS